MKVGILFLQSKKQADAKWLPHDRRQKQEGFAKHSAVSPKLATEMSMLNNLIQRLS
jgi:hypothetical protein